MEILKALNSLFSKFTPEFIANKPCMLEPEGLFELISKNAEFVLLDIRTEAERKVVSSNLPNSVSIPLHQLFYPENLNKLPKDRLIVVLCHTGERAIAAAIGLLLAGFPKVQVLSGGIAKLSEKTGRDTFKKIGEG